MNKNEKYYLVNNVLPVISCCSFLEIKCALINHFGIYVKDLKEITKRDYNVWLANNKIKFIDYRAW